MNRPHYLRVVQALALASASVGCTTTAAPAPQPVVVADAGPIPSDGGSDAAAPASPDASEDVDSGYPFSSGPVVPPELPAGFA